MKDVALSVLQLLALAIPPIAVLIRMLRRSDNLPWKYRKASFGLAISSIMLFLAAGAVTMIHLASNYAMPPLLQVALSFAVLGLVPFALFTAVLYKEHKMTFGP